MNLDIKVPHDQLLFKLDQDGTDPQTSAWVKSFLSGRTQKVVIDGEDSDAVPVTSGVPQRSRLGPILFLIFIDDMPKYVSHSKVQLFADNTIVYLSVSAVDDCNKLQEDLSKTGRERVVDGISSCKVSRPTYHLKEIQSHIPIHLTWPCL